MLDILNDLFINFTIIISSVTFGNMLLRDRLIKRSKGKVYFISVLSGVLGCILMLFSVKIADGIIVDIRWIPIMLIGIYFSLPASLFTAIIIGIFRILYFGISTPSLVALVMVLSMAIGCGLLGKTKLSNRMKWIFAFLIVSFVCVVGYALLISDMETLIDVLEALLITLMVVSFGLYHLMAYIINSNITYYKIKKDSNIDFLTGVHNVRYFDTAMNELANSTEIKGLSFSLLFIDIDHFKKVNDVYGHLSGDNVLSDLGGMLMHLSRESDLVTRKGGEEFVVLLQNTKLDNAKNFAERIRQEIEAHDFQSYNNETIKITVSLGVSNFPETTKNIEELTEQADISLYNAKRAGRNRVCAAAAIVPDAKNLNDISSGGIS